MSGLDGQLDELARSPVLLVASDFDGTLAPIVSDPGLAEPRREALVALRALAHMPQTHVAVISGRALQDLAQRTADADELHLVGSHGSEFEVDFARPLATELQQLLQRLKVAVTPFLSADPGFQLEEKPASIAIHYRGADDRAAQEAVDAILNGPARWPGVHLRHGKKVLELSVVRTDKGAALQELRSRLGASAVIFLGDDVTDEDAFLILAGPDVGVKVGPGETRAGHRVADSTAAARVLARLAESRGDWIAGAAATPIEHHSLLSDQRTVALLTPAARVTWMCLPRIDSGAVFAELVGGPTAGYFDIRPVEGALRPRQSYLGDTFVLQTAWPSMTVTDYLDCGGGRERQRAGRSDLIRAIEGRGRVRVTFAPRLDFGRIETRISATDEGLVVEGALDSLVLRAPGVRWRIAEEGRHHTATATIELTDRPVVLEMRYGTASLAPDALLERHRRLRTEQFWSSWAAALLLPSLASDQVRRSALVLRALQYGPTGAIAAAATTSLPEHVGGVRNWDYRFCWPRDAAMAAAALARLGATEPAVRFLDWVLGIFETCDETSLIAPVYTVTGGHLGPEAEIAELSGYRGSRPVRVGNAASRQVQLDVFGPIAGLVALLAEYNSALSAEHWRMLERIVAAVERHWQEPDHGIWEVRRARQHHVHSKVMCWQAVNSALAVANYVGRRRSDWLQLRARIAADVLARGWKPQQSAFCGSYDADDADASALAIGLCGLLSPDDPRFRGTVEFVERQLRSGSTTYRYRHDDGLPGAEGGFSLCTTWLIEAYALCGRRDEAHELLESYLASAGPTGLIPEEFDPDRHRGLGNFPQAYSHLGLIFAAVRLDQAARSPVTIESPSLGY